MQKASRDRTKTYYGRVTDVLADGRIRVDIDADGLWDAETAPGHVTTTFRAGETVAVHRSRKKDNWVLLSAVDLAGRVPAIPVEIIDTEGIRGRLLDGTGTEVSVDSLPGFAAGPLRPGHRCFATAIKGSEGVTTLSTNLPHLQRL